MMIDNESYDKYFKGFNIVDCIVRDRNIFYFMARQLYNTDKTPPPENKLKKRMIQHVQNYPQFQPWSFQELGGFERMYAGASVVPEGKFVGVDSNGSVYSLGGGSKGIEDNIQSWRDGGPDRGGIRRLRMIQGVLYAAGGSRTCIKRLGKNSWHGFTRNIPDSDAIDIGFDDVDGFSEKDLYCVGGAGDVWHFDGEKWRQCAFPSNVYLESVCCAGDGFVYIGAQSGNIFKGKGDSWKQIHKDKMTLPFKDMVWHQGKVWCTSDYGLWVIEGDKLVEADVPTEVRACAGNLSVADGVMLLAGIFGAAYHDGGQWHMLVASQK